MRECEKAEAQLLRCKNNNTKQHYCQSYWKYKYKIKRQNSSMRGERERNA